MQQVIVMVYEDILGFYQGILKFFRGRGKFVPILVKCIQGLSFTNFYLAAWKQIFKSLWCTFEDTFGKIVRNLERHQILIDNEAAAAHIVAEHEAREEDLRAKKEREKDREILHLRYLKEWLDPVDYQACLTKLGCPCPATGNWLVEDKDVKVWLDVKDKAKRLLWLTGIPGSGVFSRFPPKQTFG